jgi:hypothetical protein
VLLGDDVVADRQAQAGAFADRLGGEERLPLAPALIMPRLGERWKQTVIVARVDLVIPSTILARRRGRRVRSALFGICLLCYPIVRFALLVWRGRA